MPLTMPSRFLFLIGLIVTTLAAAPARGQTYNWNTTTASNAWLDPLNWAGGAPGTFPGLTANNGLPNGTSGDVAVIGTFAFTPASGLGIDFGAASGRLALGAIQFTSGTADLQIGNSSATNGILRLNGATVNGVNNVVLANTSATNNFTIANTADGTGSQTMELELGTTSAVILVNAGRTITVNSVITEASGLSGPVNLTVQGGGTVVLGAANLYTGATTVSAGVLSVSTLANGGAASGIGQSSNAAANLVLNGGAFQYTGGAVSTDRLFTLGTGASAGTLTASGSGAVNYTNAGSVAFTGSGTRTLTLAGTNTGANTLAAVLGDSGGATALTKSGAGTWVLSGANTYTGTTTVSAGRLQAGGAGAFSPSSAVNLSVTGATLDLNGTTQTIASLAGVTGSVVSLGAGNLTLGANNTSTAFAGIFSGSGTLTKTGTGTLTLSANSTWTGPLVVTGGGVVSFANQTFLNTASTATITLDNGTLRDTNAGANGTFSPASRNIVLGAGGGTLDYPTAGTLIIVQTGTVISGAGGLTKAGAGIISVVTPATYLGPTRVAAGTLRVRTNNNVFPTGTALTVDSGAAFDVANLSQQVGSLSGAGTVSIGSGAFLTGGDNTPTTFSGTITSSTGTVTKQGTGTFTVSGANTYTGNTTVSAGTLKLGNVNGLGFGGPITITSVGTTTVASGGTLDLNGTAGVNEIVTLNGAGVGANGALINSSSATLASLSNGVAAAVLTNGGSGFNGAATSISVTGGGGSGATAVASLGLTTASFTINGGTTVYSVAPTVTVSGNGVATAVLTGGVVTGITITTVGSGYTTAPTITFSGGTVTTPGTNPTGTGNALNFRLANVTITNPGTGYTSAPTFTVNGGTGAVVTPSISSTALATSTTVGGAGDLAIANIISGPAAATLTKVGTGTLTLGGANTYAGPTAINGGTLLVTNTTGSGTGTGAVTVGSGGTLGGTGIVTGAVAVTSGGAISPGNVGGVGTLTVGATTFNSGGTYQFRYNSAAPAPAAGADTNLLVGTSGSALDLSGLSSGARFNLPIVAIPTGNGPPTPLSYVFARFDTVTLPGGFTLPGIGGSTDLTSLFTITGDVSGTPFVSLNNPSGVYELTATFVPVPEPTTVLGVAALSLIVAGRVRREFGNARPGHSA